MNTRPSQRLTPIPGRSHRRREPRFALTGSTSSALELAVEHVHVLVALGLQAPRQLLRDDDRAVESAGAADPDREPALAIGLHRREDAPALGQWMAVAGLAVAPDEDLVAGFEEEDLGPDAASLERAPHRPVCRLGVAGPDVDDARHPREPARVRRDEVGELRQE